jgi:hypothetical protein
VRPSTFLKRRPRRSIIERRKPLLSVRVLAALAGPQRFPPWHLNVGTTELFSLADFRQYCHRSPAHAVGGWLRPWYASLPHPPAGP